MSRKLNTEKKFLSVAETKKDSVLFEYSQIPALKLKRGINLIRI